MGRHRVEIKKIENKAIRQVTFAKRRNGLLKKAYEISALCDIEVALLAFSPSGKPTIFGGKKRFDQILAHYINLTEHQEGGVEDVESLQRLIEGMRRERNMYNHRKIGGEMYVDAQMEEIQRDMNLVGNQFDEVTTQLKYYEEIPSYIRTVSEIEAFEEFLRQTMSQIQMQKQLLLEAHHRAPQLGQNYLMTAPLLEKLDVEIPAADQVLTGGGHSNTLHVSATTMRGNSIYNTNSNNSTLHVPQTSMLNFVDSNGSSATGNLEGQYVKNNNMVSQAPFVEERNVGPLMTRVEEGKDEVRNYYIELARRLGLSTTLPGFTFDHNTPTGSGAQQNPSVAGRGGPAGGGGGSAGPSGQASFQATRDPRRG